VFDIIESVRAQHVEVDCGALAFFERRRWNLGQRDDVRDGALVFNVECLNGPFEGRMAQDLSNFQGVIALHAYSSQRMN